MKTKDQDKNTFSYAFKQQILRAWQPVPTLQSTVVIFVVLGIYLFILYHITHNRSDFPGLWYSASHLEQPNS